MPRPSSQSPGRPSPGRSQSQRRPPKALAGPCQAPARRVKTQRPPRPPGPRPPAAGKRQSAKALPATCPRRPGLDSRPPHKALVSPRPGRKTARGSQPRPCPPLARPRSGLSAEGSTRAPAGRTSRQPRPCHSCSVRWLRPKPACLPGKARQPKRCHFCSIRWLLERYTLRAVLRFFPVRAGVREPEKNGLLFLRRGARKMATEQVTLERN